MQGNVLLNKINCEKATSVQNKGCNINFRIVQLIYLYFCRLYIFNIKLHQYCASDV